MSDAGGPGQKEGITPPNARRRRNAPLFLERQSYRRRRLTDAARLMPLLGAALFLVPLLWDGSADFETAENGPRVATSQAIVFIFGAWALLIAVTAFLGVAIGRLGRRGDETTTPEGQEQEQGDGVT